MPFVVRVTDRTDTISWLSAADEAGFRTLVPREMADVFQTVTDAHTAIANLPREVEDLGLVFEVRDGRTAAPLE
jgi:hypothetical protein